MCGRGRGKGGVSVDYSYVQFRDSWRACLCLLACSCSAPLTAMICSNDERHPRSYDDQSCLLMAHGPGCFPTCYSRLMSLGELAARFAEHFPSLPLSTPRLYSHSIAAPFTLRFGTSTSGTELATRRPRASIRVPQLWGEGMTQQPQREI